MNKGNVTQVRNLRSDLDGLRDEVGTVDSWSEISTGEGKSPRFEMRVFGQDRGPWTMVYTCAYVRGLVDAACIDGWTPPRLR